jgi:hypothetical protein
MTSTAESLRRHFMAMMRVKIKFDLKKGWAEEAK